LTNLTKENIVAGIKKIAGKNISLNDCIYGYDSCLKSIDFVQFIAYVEDEFLNCDNVDLLYEFCNHYKEATLNDLYDFVKKWI
tara:strand:+ start:124 stop:372 length:249 start_codon:yes stop_codon:yes gene_type:complete